MSARGGRRLIWDLPTRIFHWAIVLVVAFSWWSAENGEMEWHYRSGLLACGLLIFRVLWGFIGARTAHFADFIRGPRAVARYLRGNTTDASAADGHNPLGGWSVLLMILLLLLQVTSGLFAVDIDGLESGPLSYLVDFDQGRIAAEIHELSFLALQLAIALHVLAILFYALVRKQNLTAAMITGYRRHGEALNPPMQRAPKWRFFIAFALAALLTYAIAQGFRF